VENFVIKSIRQGVREEKSDAVTEEVPLTIELNGSELATLLCSPTDLKNLVIGFLYTSGFIEDALSITSLIIDQDRWKAYVDCTVTFPSEMLFKRIYTSGCGKGIIFHNPLDLMQRVRLADGFTIAGENFFGMMKKFITSSEEFRLTGGVHSAALVGGTEMIFKDDLGRHNALDKVIGDGLQKKIDFSAQVALTSGRVSSEVVAKVLRCQIPIMASSGAPTNQAVKIAREANMTLLGFVRGQRLNVYSGEQRIV
jgi:FdhD protein